MSADAASASSQPVSSGEPPRSDVTPPAAGSLAAYDRRLEEDLVTVEDVGEAWTGTQPHFNDNEQSRAMYHQYFRRFADHLRKKDPGFRHYFFGDGSGVTLYQGQLHIFRSPLPGKSLLGRADTMLFRSDRMAIGAHEFIEGPQLRNCLNMIYDVALSCCQVIQSINDPRPTAAETQDATLLAETLDFLEEELRRIGQYFDQAARRRAQVRYAKGMLIGALVIYAATLVIWLGAQIGDLETKVPELGLALGIVVFGCTGAVVSVMQRMTRSKLEIDYSMGTTVRTLGMFRPAIGAIFAVAAFVFVRGELIPQVNSPSGRASSYFFLALAFLMGFSERVAQDMLTATEDKLAGPDTSSAGSPDDAPQRAGDISTA